MNLTGFEVLHDSLSSVSEVDRVDGAPRFPPADQVLAGGALARVEALGSWRDRALRGGGGGRGGGRGLVSGRVVTGAEHSGAARVTRAMRTRDKRLKSEP